MYEAEDGLYQRGEMQRRQFLKTGAMAGLAVATQRKGFADETSAQSADAVLAIDASDLGRVVPETFTGLSYELAQLTEPNFFSAANQELVAFFRRLSPRGALRIGGNSSEFCWFRATPTTPPIELKLPTGNLSKNWMPHRIFVIEPKAIENLAGFLEATGWEAIYGLNYGHSTPERAAEEAAFVHAKLGDRLRFFQIGNEPDFYRDANNGVRPAGWGFDDYVREWIAYADAVTARVPQARFGGPDTGASSDWIIRFGEQVAPKLGSKLEALTGHYYAEGPPDAPSTTIARLLAGDPNVARSTKEIVAVADAHHLVYRMTEGNSCYRGGKPGMSDAFASTVWAADYLLELASLGCAGVNLHGGKAHFLAASLGDHNPGDAVSGALPHKRTNGFYTPISSEDGEKVFAMPVFYGMLFAQRFAGAQMLRVEQPANQSCRIYSALRDKRLVVGLINKSTQPLEVHLRFAHTETKSMQPMFLTAPALDSADVQFGGAAIAAGSAAWQPNLGKPLPVHDGLVTVHLNTGAVLLEQL